MTAEQLEPVVLKTLAEVAPELEETTLDRAQPFREQLDLDSIDFLRFVVALSRAAGRDIPERDYPKLASVASCARYLAAASPAVVPH
jgi:acyl carrier protein